MKIDLAVLGVPRTGTTLMANLLTVPEERRWCAVEPGSFRGQRQGRIYNRASLLGWSMPSNKIDDVLEFVATLDRFGVKEVHEGQIGGVMAACNPERVVACVRDARDIFVSLADPRFVHRRGTPKPEGMARMTGRYLDMFLNWAERSQVTIVRYEDLVASPAYRKKLGEILDWPLTGDPNRNMDAYRRGDEKRDGVFSRRDGSGREEHAALVAQVHEACRAYQEQFGY